MSHNWLGSIDEVQIGELKTWKSNEEILLNWFQEMDDAGEPTNTIRGRRTATNWYQQWCGDRLFTTIKSVEFEHFATKLRSKCSNFVPDPRNPGAMICAIGRSLTSCPMINAHHKGSRRDCHDYAALKPTSVDTQLNRISALYIWLNINGYCDHNPVQAAAKQHRQKNKKEISRARRSPGKYPITAEQVVQLYHGSSPHAAAIYAFMVKTFTRPHEAVKMRHVPEILELDEILVPEGGVQGDKREGNNILVVDDELRWILREYLPIRERLINRDKHGVPTHDYLFVSERGGPWSPTAFDMTLGGRLRMDLVRSGVQTGKEGRGKRITPHSFRGLAVTMAEENNCPSDWIRAMKGDVFPGSIGSYFDFKRKLREKYLEHGPKLGLRRASS